MPITGCTMRPESGPARKTIAISDLDRPSESKYGEAVMTSVFVSTRANFTGTQPYDISTDQSVCTPKRPTVSDGSRAQAGPTTRATPAQRRLRSS